MCVCVCEDERKNAGRLLRLTMMSHRRVKRHKKVEVAAAAAVVVVVVAAVL